MINCLQKYFIYELERLCDERDWKNLYSKEELNFKIYRLLKETKSSLSLKDQFVGNKIIPLMNF